MRVIWSELIWCCVGHGLQKYTTMRTRYAATLRNAAGVKEYVFIGTLGFARKDGRTNGRCIPSDLESLTNVLCSAVSV
jgi:hypothetical protein